MPLKHLRVCEHCQAIRFGQCSLVCRAPNPDDPASWQENMQTCAGMLPWATRQNDSVVIPPQNA